MARPTKVARTTGPNSVIRYYFLSQKRRQFRFRTTQTFLNFSQVYCKNNVKNGQTYILIINSNYFSPRSVSARTVLLLLFPRHPSYNYKPADWCSPSELSASPCLPISARGGITVTSHASPSGPSHAKRKNVLPLSFYQNRQPRPPHTHDSHGTNKTG